MKKDNNRPEDKKPLKESRRDFMKSAGKLALWIPPALVVLTHSKEALAKKSWKKDWKNKHKKKWDHRKKKRKKGTH